MQTQITFRHFNGQHPQLHNEAEDLAKSFLKYNDKIISVNCEFINESSNKDESSKVVNFVVHLSGATLTATEETDDLHKSLHIAAEKIIKQILKNKEKQRN